MVDQPVRTSPIEWTPANVVTMVRVCLIPVFVALILCPWTEWLGIQEAYPSLQPVVAMCVFALISLTDSLDGYLARSRNEITVFGKFMDPIADKVLVVTGMLCLVELQLLPSWIPIIVISREFLVSGLRMLVASSGTVVAASWIGKAKTLTTMFAISMFIVIDAPVFNRLGEVFDVLAWALMLSAVVLTIWSMVDYFVKAWPLLDATSGSPSAPAEPVASAETLDSQDVLAVEVVSLACSRGVKLATAESCTGGLVSAALTSVPGSSQAVLGGIVSYDECVKVASLGVDPSLIAEDGVVSTSVASAMAQGAARVLGADYAVSVTGLAGPGGGIAELPVGTVCLALSGPSGSVVERHVFQGNREQVRSQSVRRALELFKDALK